MGLFSDATKLGDELISCVFSIKTIYKDGTLKGILSSPKAVIDPNEFHLATILQKKILDVSESDFSGEILRGEQITIDRDNYLIVDIIPGNFGNRNLVLEKIDENGN